MVDLDFQYRQEHDSNALYSISIIDVRFAVKLQRGAHTVLCTVGGTGREPKAAANAAHWCLNLIPDQLFTE